MAAGPAPMDRPRMDTSIFIENFGADTPRKTYLCYEWEVPEGDSRIPAHQLKGFLRNKGAYAPGGPRHAELCFLDLTRSWGLDKEKHYSVTLFISWSPCPECASSLVDFLSENSRVSLRIFVARIYEKLTGFEGGLRQLQAAGVQVSIMDIPEYQHCWETFVNHQGRPFQPRDDLHPYIQRLSSKLEGILQGN